jgi:hypothetical protein
MQVLYLFKLLIYIYICIMYFFVHMYSAVHMSINIVKTRDAFKLRYRF